MTAFYMVLFFLFGVTFGSFFNVVGLRVPKKETFVNDRSYCPNCKQTLSWYELIPVFSYVIQAGKCRNCKQPISIIYPTIELFTGLLFAYSFWHIGWTWELLTAVLFVSMLMIILVTDITYMLIPNHVLLFFLPLFIIMRFIVPLDPWWSPVVGALGAALLLAIIIIVSRGGMGAGDMKLFFLLGIVLGIGKVFLAFFLSVLLGAVIGVILIALKVVERKNPIAFGPFIVVAALISYFYGDTLIDWYLGLL